MPGPVASTASPSRADYYYFFFLDVRPVGLLAFARSLAAALFCAFVDDLVASFLAAFFASFLDVSPPGLAAFARSLAAALFCAFVDDFAPSFLPAFFASFLVVVANFLPLPSSHPVDGAVRRGYPQATSWKRVDRPPRGRRGGSGVVPGPINKWPSLVAETIVSAGRHRGPSAARGCGRNSPGPRPRSAVGRTTRRWAGHFPKNLEIG